MSSVIPVNPVPLPIGDPISEPRKDFAGQSLADVIQYIKAQDSSGFITQTWLRFFSNQQAVISSSPIRIGSVTAANQSAAIGATDISGGTLAGGLYRWSYYIRPVVAAGATSTYTVSWDWVDKGVVETFTATAVTSNSVTSWQSDSRMIRADGASPIRYAVAYGSTGAPAMSYDAVFILERVQA